MIFIILLYFLLGVLTYSFVIPIVEQIVSVLLTSLELVKGKLTLKITEVNCQIKKAQESESESKTHAIGFCAPFYEEEDEEEDV